MSDRFVLKQSRVISKFNKFDVRYQGFRNKDSTSSLESSAFNQRLDCDNALSCWRNALCYLCLIPVNKNNYPQ